MYANISDSPNCVHNVSPFSSFNAPLPNKHTLYEKAQWVKESTIAANKTCQDHLLKL